MFEAERPKLVPYAGRFDGFHAVPASVSKTCLVRFDNNKYSVAAGAVGRPVEVQAYADRIVIRQDGRVVGEHRRSFGRGETIYDPWHYVPVLARKPGALRNGAPFKDWVLPAAMERVRRKLAGADDGLSADEGDQEWTHRRRNFPEEPSEPDWNRRAQVIEHGTVEIDHLFQPFYVGVSRRALHDDRSGNVLEARTRPLINTEEAAQIL